MNSEEKALIERCYYAGMTNPWASGSVDKQDGNFLVKEDRLNKKSIHIIKTLAGLKLIFKRGNTTLGTGLIYKNLFFLQQVDGGDEWAIYKITKEEIFQFESMGCGRMLKGGKFDKALKDILKATDEQLKKLEY